MTSIAPPKVMPQRTTLNPRRCACGRFQLPPRRDFVYNHPGTNRSDQHGPLSCEQIALGEQPKPVDIEVEVTGWNLYTGRFDRKTTKLVTVQPPRRIDFRRLDQ